MSSSQTYLVFTSSENIFAFAINPTNNCALVGFFSPMAWLSLSSHCVISSINNSS